MKKNIIVSIFIVVNILFFSITCFSEEITINSDEFQVNLLSSTDQQTTIEYTFGSFNAKPITIEGQQYHHLLFQLLPAHRLRQICFRFFQIPNHLVANYTARYQRPTSYLLFLQ